MTSNTVLTDARGSLPSASAMTRIFNCPASYKLNAAETPETSAAAEEGRLLHRVMELAVQKFPEDIHEALRDDFDDVKSRLSDEQEQAFNTACWLVSRNVVERNLSAMNESAQTQNMRGLIKPMDAQKEPEAGSLQAQMQEML